MTINMGKKMVMGKLLGQMVPITKERSLRTVSTGQESLFGLTKRYTSEIG